MVVRATSAKLPGEDLMDALSLTRERVGVGFRSVPDTRILIREAFGRSACTVSPTLSRKLNGREARRGYALAVGVYRQSRMREGCGTLVRGALFLRCASKS